MTEGYFLEWPDNEKRSAQLRRKLKEYAERVEHFKKRLEQEESYFHPELIGSLIKQSPNYMRFLVLSELEKEKEIDTQKLSTQLYEEGLIKDERSIKEYNTACAIIRDYCETGGKNCIGGTGLR